MMKNRGWSYIKDFLYNETFDSNAISYFLELYLKHGVTKNKTYFTMYKNK